MQKFILSVFARLLAALTVKILCAVGAVVDIVDTSLHKMRWGEKKSTVSARRDKRPQPLNPTLHFIPEETETHRSCYLSKIRQLGRYFWPFSEGEVQIYWPRDMLGRSILFFLGLSKRWIWETLWYQELVTYIKKFVKQPFRTLISKGYLWSTIKMSSLENDTINFYLKIKKKWFRKNNIG